VKIEGCKTIDEIINALQDFIDENENKNNDDKKIKPTKETDKKPVKKHGGRK
jgi:hypothetical protein